MPVCRLIVRGVVRLSLDKGATPAGGGKASAALFGRTCLRRKCRARFWATSSPASPPSSRSVRRWCEAEGRGRATTLDREPRPMGQARATFGGRADWSEAEIARAKRRAYARPNRAREWESQSRSLEERERTTQRPRAEGQRIIRPCLGITIALAPRYQEFLITGVIRKLLLSGKSVSSLRAVDEEGCA